MAPYDTAKEIFGRAFPSEVLRLQPPNDWLGEFPLPLMVTKYFAEFGPVDIWIEGYGNHYFLPSLSRLWHYQAATGTIQIRVSVFPTGMTIGWQ